MCNNCYHSSGRNKKAWKCRHVHKSHYALGICQACYQSKFITKVKKTLHENNVNNNNNNNVNFNNNNNKNINFNYPFNLNNIGILELAKVSNLISELINLEQQNKFQIDCIQKIINNKYKYNNMINNLLLNILSNNENEIDRDMEKNEDGTTKNSSRSSEDQNKNRGNSNSTLNNFEHETLKAENLESN